MLIPLPEDMFTLGNNPNHPENKKFDFLMNVTTSEIKDLLDDSNINVDVLSYIGGPSASMTAIETEMDFLFVKLRSLSKRIRKVPR